MTIEEIVARDVAEAERAIRERDEAAALLKAWREKHPYRRPVGGEIAAWAVLALFALATVAVAVRAYLIRQDLNQARAAWAAERANY